MNEQFKKIPHTINQELDYIHPYNQIGNFTKLTDPALSVIFDLSHVNVISIDPKATINDASLEMKFSHSHVLLVIDIFDKVVGLITQDDINGAKPLKVAKENKIKFSDIKIESLMLPQEKVLIFDQEDLKLAKVGNVIKTMKELKQNVAEVIEFDPILKTYCISGLICLSMVSKQLGFDVTNDITKPYSIIEIREWLL
ncbi:MAG: CBS domain-containing protein [Gammaproteobacteria bacterium]